MSTALPRIGLGLIELPIACGVAFALFLAVYRGGCAFTTCVDVSGLPWILLGALVGLVAGIVYWIVAARMKARWRRRIAFDAVAIVIGLAAIVLPQIEAQRRSSNQQAATAAANERMAAKRPRDAASAAPRGDLLAPGR